jgi:magnesium transporter
MIVEHGVLGPDFRPAASVEDALTRAHAGGGVAWVALQDPGEAEVESVFTAVGQGRPGRQVADHRWGHAGFIGLPDHHQLTLIEVDEDGSDLAPIVLQVVVGPDHLIVLRRGGAVNAVTDLRRRTEERLVELGEAAPKAWVAVVALLLVHFDAYDRMLHGIEDAVESLNDRLFPAPDDTVLEDTHRVNQWITRSGRAVRVLAQGLAEAAADDQLAADAEVRRAIVRLRRVAEDLVQRVVWAEQTVSSVAGTMLGLTGQRTNDLSARQAAVAQRISAYALLFAIPNALFALYGTNFEHLPRILTREYGYAVLLGITAVLMVVVAWRLRRNGWL